RRGEGLRSGLLLTVRVTSNRVIRLSPHELAAGFPAREPLVKGVVGQCRGLPAARGRGRGHCGRGPAGVSLVVVIIVAAPNDPECCRPYAE
ncbi:MAG TPA: hypothetical protein PKC45_16950, partial [Gemmatales bacterium]|nr:hypothetical protein [Gemmatales bacterium]